jgi:ATP-binding cassette, subfamily B, multidrug efflux pump
MSSTQGKQQGDSRRVGGGGPGGGGPVGGPGGGGPGHMGMKGEKPKDFKGTLRRLLKYLKPFRVNLIVVMVFAVLSTVFTIYSPQVTREAMNSLQDAYVAKMVVTKMSEAQHAVKDKIDASMNSGSSSGSSGNAGTMPSADAMKALEEFLALPMLDTLTDANQKADVVQKMLDLMKILPDFQAGSAEGAGTVTSGAIAPATEGAAVTAPKGFTMTAEQLQGSVQAIRDTNGKVDRDYIARILAFLGLLFLLSSGFTFIMGWLMAGVAQKTVYLMRRDVDAKLSRLPLRYFDTRTHGEIMSRVTNDMDTIAGTLQQSLTQIITSVVSLVGYVVMMLTISGTLTLIVLLTLPLYVVATVGVTKRSQKYFARQQKQLGRLSGHVEEMYTGHKIVKVFGKEGDAIRDFEATNQELYESGWKAQFISGIMWPLMSFVSNIGYVMISVVGGLWITMDRLKIGDITAFITYSRSFTQPILQTANIANVLQSTIACAERVFEVLDEVEELPEPASPACLESPKGEVSVEGVSFRYKEDEPLIENMNLDVKQGHTVAIVGPTGAGKTTLVNLLMRFYELDKGRITIDGTDIRDMRRGDLRSLFGMVLQDTWLFNGTIRDNIMYGRTEATEAEMVEAAKAAHADHFIRTLPEGYDTVLNEEATNISQGQKQLLTIARAILANPAILILDEATSSVDTRTEVLIQAAMANLMKDRTSFVIAHRLSTIRGAELILVMNNGSIIEQGTHRELLAQNGFYADLYNSQFTGAAVA